MEASLPFLAFAGVVAVLVGLYLLWRSDER